MLELGSDVIFHHIVPWLGPPDLQALRASCQDLYLLVGISRPWQLARRYPLLPGMANLSDWPHFYRNRAAAGTWLAIPGTTAGLVKADCGDGIRDIGLLENYLIVLSTDGLLHVYAAGSDDAETGASQSGEISTELLARLGPPSSSVIDMVCGANSVLVRDSDNSVWALAIDDSTISVSGFDHTFDPGTALVRGPLMSTPSPNPEFSSSSPPLSSRPAYASYPTSPTRPSNRSSKEPGRTLMTTANPQAADGRPVSLHAVVDPHDCCIVVSDGEGPTVKLDYGSGVVTAITSSAIESVCFIVFSKSCGGLYYVELVLDSRHWRSQVPPIRQIFGRYPTCHRLAMAGRRLVGVTEYGMLLDLTVGKLGFEDFHQGSFVDVCAGSGTFAALDSHGTVYRWGSTWLSESEELGLGDLQERPPREGIEYKQGFSEDRWWVNVHKPLPICGPAALRICTRRDKLAVLSCS